MARPGTAASRPANLNEDFARPDEDGSLAREQKIELYYYMSPTRSLEDRSPPLEDYVLPQTPDIVLALRKLASY